MVGKSAPPAKDLECFFAEAFSVMNAGHMHI
jgi:hypothetical protein